MWWSASSPGDGGVTGTASTASADFAPAAQVSRIHAKILEKAGGIVTRHTGPLPARLSRTPSIPERPQWIP